MSRTRISRDFHPQLAKAERNQADGPGTVSRIDAGAGLAAHAGIREFWLPSCYYPANRPKRTGRTTKCDSEDRGVVMGTSPWMTTAEIPQQPAVSYSAEGAEWYALHTKPQHEKSVVAHLQRQGLTTFLPVVSEVHRWSDRQKVVQLPLFSCYAFVYLNLVPESWARVMSVTGVLRFVGGRRGGIGIPIPDTQIHAVQTLLTSKLPYSICPFLEVGQRVRIRGGALHGVEGILTGRTGDRVLIISVQPIQRSLSVRIGDYGVEVI